MIDQFERNINYLRISVTDRCNLRCVYCSPPGGIKPLNKNLILSYEEILRVVKIGSRLGIEKIRLTGGEPLVRNGLIQFISALRQINGLKEVTLTTNGYYLKDVVLDLKKVGLARLNISLDSLKSDVYSKITRGGDLKKVLAGIQQALKLGLKIKINVVILKKINESEILNFLRFGAHYGIEIRFIEFMPLCGSNHYRNYFVSLDSIQKKIKQTTSLVYVGFEGVAKTYQYNGIKVGFIAPMTSSFCSECSRLRLTAEGYLRPCLFSNTGVNLLPLLRSETSDVEISNIFLKVAHVKPYSYHASNESVLMRRIGG
jgi:cyclic pyranopterin phosphate synthase